MNYFLIFFLIIFSALKVNADTDEVYFTDVAKGEYNRIVLPKPYRNMVVSKGAKIDKPIKLVGGTLLLIRPLKTALKQFTVTFVLVDGDSFDVIFNPVSRDRPIVWRYKDAADVQEHIGPTLNDKHLWLARIFPEAHLIYYGMAEDGATAPRGFTKVDTPSSMSAAVKTKSGKVVKLTLTPKIAWRGMGHVLSAYQLSSLDALEIEPSDFWYKGVVAVSTEYDFVSKGKSPYIFILSKDS